MKSTFKYLVAALAALSAIPLAAHATSLTLNFSFDDQYGLVTGYGTFDATALNDGSGAYFATGGMLQITAPFEDDISGAYQLYPNLAGTTASNSPTGLFIYDNLLMPGANPVVTNPGILGFGGLASGSNPEGRGREINFFSTGLNTYDLYTADAGHYPYSHEFTTAGPSATGHVEASAFRPHSQLVAAPEPSEWVIMGSFLGLALYKVRSRTRVRV